MTNPLVRIGNRLGELKYVRLGNSGLVVSQFCLGAWHLPGAGQMDEFGIEKVDGDEFRGVVKRAYDVGMNFIDCANRYHGRMSTADVNHVGNSERLLGDILKEYDRESWVIATKVRGKMATWPNGEGLSRKHIMWQIGESLKRLNVKYVDLYQVHWEDPETSKRETLKSLNGLIGQGLVRYIGESNHSPSNVVEFMETAERLEIEGFVSMQEPYNLLERQIEKEKFPVARRYGMAVMAYVPLAQGVLSGKYLKGVKSGSRASYISEMKAQYLNDETSRAVGRLLEVAGEKGISLPQLALSWMLQKQSELGVTIVPIIGITKSSYLDDDLASLDVKLSSADMRNLEEIAATAKMGPQSY
jgi:aryl-alcohol dehydrogenase-like predicted oxidoreductase